jgi:ATP/maltotriose-dependent transcriptional regulator MalT
VLSLVELAEQARDDDPDLALTLLHAAGLRSWWGDPGVAVRERVVAAAGAAVMQCAVAGVRGDEERAEWHAGECERLIQAHGSSDILCVLQNSRGLTSLALGHCEDAYAQLVRIFDPADPAYHDREKYVAVGQLADAALATGRERETAALVVELADRAELSADRALLHGLHYARALLAEDDDAEDAFAVAFDAIGPQWAFNRARLNLAYGAWLRRRRRVTESREPLRAARDAFDQLDVPAWSDRARHELRAAGEVSRRRRLEAWDELSPQELQIAKLAATGLSNREIGQRLSGNPKGYFGSLGGALGQLNAPWGSPCSRPARWRRCRDPRPCACAAGGASPASSSRMFASRTGGCTRRTACASCCGRPRAEGPRASDA